ncbi:phospholipase A2 [Candidatus Poriferisocius sp.]|uniref:phospholipase A2 n=1 Tax=Candidatus Poriferisocius sp. TaxID=3101276 RepID=UPI003B02A6C4
MEPDSAVPSRCGSVGTAFDGGTSETTPSELVGSVPTNPDGVVGQTSEQVTYTDPALNILKQHTELLNQSDNTAPAIVGGKLDSGCGVTFVLEGKQEEVGAIGLVGLGVDDNSRWLVQGLEGGRGYRMMIVLESVHAPTSHTVKLKLDQNISVLTLENGGAIFVNKEDLVIGSIAEPWALDANGQQVPITQTITKTDIRITVDTSNVTAWPVVADPEYHTFRCNSQSQVTKLGTAKQYLNGQRCPEYRDIVARGYYPKWIKHFSLWRVGKADGGCGEPLPIPDRLNIWGIGVIYDFRQACKGHDYCYDLGHSKRLNYANMNRLTCDNIMYNDMKYDCSKRSTIHKPKCYSEASKLYIGARSLGTWLF